jgi:hypothetical protein
MASVSRVPQQVPGIFTAIRSLIRAPSPQRPRKQNPQRKSRVHETAEATVETYPLQEQGGGYFAAMPAREPGLSVEAAQRMDAAPLTDEDSTSAPLPTDYPYRTCLRRNGYEAEKRNCRSNC